MRTDINTTSFLHQVLRARMVTSSRPSSSYRGVTSWHFYPIRDGILGAGVGYHILW